MLPCHGTCESEQRSTNPSKFFGQPSDTPAKHLLAQLLTAAPLTVYRMGVMENPFRVRGHHQTFFGEGFRGEGIYLPHTPKSSTDR
jgi:hypothetical protein